MAHRRIVVEDPPESVAAEDQRSRHGDGQGALHAVCHEADRLGGLGVVAAKVVADTGGDCLVEAVPAILGRWWPIRVETAWLRPYIGEVSQKKERRVHECDAMAVGPSRPASAPTPMRKVQGRFREGTGKVQGRRGPESAGECAHTYAEGSGKVQGRFREGSGRGPESAGECAHTLERRLLEHRPHGLRHHLHRESARRRKSTSPRYYIAGDLETPAPRTCGAGRCGRLGATRLPPEGAGKVQGRFREAWRHAPASGRGSVARRRHTKVRMPRSPSSLAPSVASGEPM